MRIIHPYELRLEVHVGRVGVQKSHATRPGLRKITRSYLIAGSNERKVRKGLTKARYNKNQGTITLDRRGSNSPTEQEVSFNVRLQLQPLKRRPSSVVVEVVEAAVTALCLQS